MDGPSIESRNDQTSPQQAAPRRAAELPSRRAEAWLRFKQRAPKSSFGLALLATAGWFSVRQFVWTISSEATVITPPIAVTAPIDGFVHHALGDDGKVFAAGSELARIENPLLDRSKLAELTAREAALDAKVAELETKLSALSELAGQFEARGSAYDRARRQRLELLFDETNAKHEAELAKLGEVETRKQRLDALSAQGLASKADSQTVDRDLRMARAEAAGAQLEMDLARSSLDAQNRGVAIEPYSTMDRSYSSSRVDDVRMHLAQLKADLAFKRAERQANELELSGAREHFEKHSKNVVSAPSRVRVFQITAHDGEYVESGKPLFRLLDCSRTRVVAYVSERNYARLHIGDPADVAVADRPGALHARVTTLLGNPEQRGAGEIFGLPDELRGRFAVVVSSEELSRSNLQPCEAGRSAEVRFYPR
jgi:multidrug resistance efflux pump